MFREDVLFEIYSQCLAGKLEDGNLISFCFSAIRKRTEVHLKQLVLFSTLTACYLELSAHLMDRGLGGLLFALLQYQTDGLGGDKKKKRVQDSTSVCLQVNFIVH